VERYPLILRDADEFPKPRVHNLYLDFNGVVHNATHGNAEVVNKTEQQMMGAMFAELEKLFAVAEPSKLLFIAIDGVRRGSALRAPPIFGRGRAQLSERGGGQCPVWSSQTWCAAHH